MRLLFTFAGGSGHADPLVPLARAAAAAGHTVAFAGRPSVVARLATLGFATFAEQADDEDAPQAIAPLLELSAEREDRALRDGFAGHVARRRFAAVLALCRAWSPDVVVCDETDFGAMVAAERSGVPHATVLVTAAGFVRTELVAEPLDALRAEHGLEADPGVRMASRHLVLSPFPLSFRDPAFPLPATAHPMRPVMPGGGAGPRGGAPTVYVTLGTVFNMESGDLFDRLLAALADLPVEVIVTVGAQLDPRRFGPQPANVRIESYIPQEAVLSRCDVMVSHGGSGSVLGALAAGVPSVVLPMGADQPLNAARCEALGAGIVLDARRASPAEIREAVRTVLGEPAHRASARRIREEILGLPGPEHAVRLLRRLAA
jgi:UDP:flavonoid glycosyltransferase YjiC (YdhE family)